jgi:hypothetical protein
MCIWDKSSTSLDVHSPHHDGQPNKMKVTVSRKQTGSKTQSAQLCQSSQCIAYTKLHREVQMVQST